MFSVSCFWRLGRAYRKGVKLMAGSLNKSEGSGIKRQIKIVNITGNTVTQMENAFNNNYGNKGWRIVQVIVIGANTYLIAEKEI